MRRPGTNVVTVEVAVDEIVFVTDVVRDVVAVDVWVDVTVLVSVVYSQPLNRPSWCESIAVLRSVTSLPAEHWTAKNPKGLQKKVVGVGRALSSFLLNSSIIVFRSVTVFVQSPTLRNSLPPL